MKQKIFAMKKLYFVLFIIFASLQTKAQVDSIQLALDNIFQYVDKSQVPTGFLEEYSAQFVNLKTFNGVLTDSNTVNAMAWHYIYASLSSGRIYGTNPLPSPITNDSVFTSEAKLNPNAYPVSMLALNYNSIKTDAMETNLFTMSNNQLYDVAGRSQSPYVLNTAFAAAPFYETDDDGVLNLIFKQDLFINNTGKSVATIQVNFNTGAGFVTAGWNSIITASYPDTGVKKLTIKLSFTDGSMLQCYSDVNILKGASGTNFYQPSTTTIPFNPTGNNHSGGDITVQYSVNNTTPIGNKKFQKPFIVVEGYDMHDAAPLLMPRGYDYNSFRDELDLVNFSNNSFNGNLDNIASYDLIFLNYRDGTDNILRNAALLEEVITWVNNNKAAGAQQNVVMGLSMGGLVSRYCLAKMTKAGNSPQTRLLVTHDSPHRGANIPLGMQYLVNDFANKKLLGRKLREWIPLLGQAVKLQLRDATMQQLLVRNNPDNGNLEYNTFLVPGGVYRQMITFTSSDPQPGYRFVATSQGSQCGIPVMPPSQEILHASANAGFSFGLFKTFGDKYFGEVSINALPNGTASQRITYFNIKHRIKFLWINFNSTFLNFTHYSPAGILGYDGCPAGTIPLSRGTGLANLPPINIKSPGWLVILFGLKYSANFDGLQLQPEFSFVPTVSALDEDNITATSLYAAHLGTQYTPPTDITLLQRYIAQEKQTTAGVSVYNIPHTDFTARSSNWIFNEMENLTQTPNCNDFCGSTTISGPTTFCNLGDYSILNLPPGSSVTWSAAPAGIVQFSCTSCLQTTITKLTDGFVTLTATISNACSGTITVTKENTIVGTPRPLIAITYFGLNFRATASVIPGATYNWYFNNVLTSAHGGTYLDGVDQCGVSNTLAVEAINSCGISAKSSKIINIKCGPRLQISVFPNPGSNSVDLKTLDNTSFKKVIIYDKLGGLWKELNFPSGTKKATLNIIDLPTDVYQIQVFDGNTWKTISFIKL